MSTSQFRRAKLVPFDAGGQNAQEARAIALDFNPETLTLKVSGGEQKDKGRRGRQQVQNVGASKATLSFECIFDSTRPRDAATGEPAPGGEEMLDVRLRTKPIADLLQVFSNGKEQAPRRVQFRWGTLIFNGVISSHQEVFDYFSPSGVPLRSKVQLTLTEQEFRYEINAADAAQRRQAVEQAASGARQQAAAAGAGSVLGGGAGGPDLSAGFSLDASLDPSLNIGLSAELGFSATLGPSADIGVALGAGIDLDATVAADLFGGATIAGGTDLGRSGAALPPPSPGLAAAGAVPNPWAPDGPAPGSAAAGLAAVVAGQRAGGAVRTADTSMATATSASRMPPLRGSPPLTPRLAVDAGEALFASPLTSASLATGERRPRWEGLSPLAATGVGTRMGGCGCGGACGGGGCGGGCGCRGGRG
ncbi:MAG TPA: hypothetical protein PLS67_02205 [Accumulibacter sp.]|jgi:hypothetical protein|nr:hypothetical protein [Accumulibacter sp.]HQC79319.1 hypothetical protein [Accumulibacter sp.]